MIPLLWCLRLVDGSTVCKEFGIPLIVIAAHEPVEAVKPEKGACGPAVIRTGRATFFGRSVMPLANTEGIVAMLTQHRPNSSSVHGLASVVAGIASCQFGNVCHGVGVMIA